MLLKFHKIFSIILIMLCLNGCYSKTESKFFPYKLPDAVINQPYSVTLYNFVGYVGKNDIQLQIIPDNKSLKVITSREDNSHNTVKFVYTPTQIGQYNVNVSGFGQSNPFPREFFNHTYILNVLDQSSICKYQEIIYNDPKEKYKLKDFIKINELPKATIGKEYHQEIMLIPTNMQDDDLRKKNIQLVTYPEDSGLKIRPVSGDGYNTVELYGIPKTIGNTRIIFKRYKINDPTTTYEYKSYNLPVIPDQSSCR